MNKAGDNFVIYEVKFALRNCLYHQVLYMVFIRQRYCKWLLSTFPHISWISHLQIPASQKC